MEKVAKIKICGITNLSDAQMAINAGADMIGLNFFSGSKRNVDTEKAELIVEHLPSPITKVGVFVNQSHREIAEVQRLVGLDVIQLHGDESPEFVDELRREITAEIVKVFRVGDDFERPVLDDYEIDGVMLDTFSTSAFGGTGTVFDWSVAAEIAKDVDNLYLAGGLNPKNIADAIRTVRPYAVDVASGVESWPGKKDPKKLEAFIRNAKNA